MSALPDEEWRRQIAVRQREEAAGIPMHRRSMIVSRLTDYLSEYAPRHQHLVHAALEHYASNLGQLWGDLAKRYGRPRWTGGEPRPDPEARNPLAAVPGYVESSGAAASSGVPTSSSSSSSPPALAKHELEPPS
jgi:hypothetical protein